MIQYGDASYREIDELLCYKIKLRVHYKEYTQTKSLSHTSLFTSDTSLTNPEEQIFNSIHRIMYCTSTTGNYTLQSDTYPN